MFYTYLIIEQKNWALGAGPWDKGSFPGLQGGLVKAPHQATRHRRRQCGLPVASEPYRGHPTLIRADANNLHMLCGVRCATRKSKGHEITFAVT